MRAWVSEPVSFEVAVAAAEDPSSLAEPSTPESFQNYTSATPIRGVPPRLDEQNPRIS